MEHDYLLKVVLVGDMAVGKTSLLLRYVDDSYTDTHVTTIGVDFKLKTTEVANAVVKLQLWDTAGQERFRSIASSFYRGADGVIVVYDVTEMTSFEKVASWFKEIEHYGNPSSVRLLVGNKSDLETKRVVTTQQGKELADKLGVSFLETSAKNRINVLQTFDSMVTAMVGKRKADVLISPFGGAKEKVTIESTEAGTSWCFGGACSLV